MIDMNHFTVIKIHVCYQLKKVYYTVFPTCIYHIQSVATCFSVHFLGPL